MFFRLFAVFAMLAVAFASPKPDIVTYAAAPGVAVPLTYSAFPGPVAYSAPYAAAPLTYTYPAGAYYVK